MIRVYLTPFSIDGSTFSDEVEITQDVDQNSIGKITEILDNSTYDIGVLRFSNLKLKLRNQNGKYSEAGEEGSLFLSKRSGSKVRVTWDISQEGPYCGVAICGEVFLGEEMDLYEGILEDEAAKMNSSDQIIEFQVLSPLSLLKNVIVPASVAIGDLLSEAIYKVLNQSLITKYLSVDASNISCTVDYQIDALDDLENKTGREALEKLLLVSNSVLYIIGSDVFVSSRAASVDVKKTFYGQASQIGNENILNLREIRNGQNRIINFATWTDTTSKAEDSTSIAKWGYRKTEVSAKFVTTGSKQLQTLQSFVDEFKNPKMELSLESVLDYETFELLVLDKIDIDYPTIVYNTENRLPIIDSSELDDPDVKLPYELWEFEIDQETQFKILGKELDLKKEVYSYRLREV